MSLGFLTESALLPSKSKAIIVDSKSILDLKAIVYEKEQELKRNDSSSRGLRKRPRRSSQSTTNVNKGIEQRQARDEASAFDDSLRGRKKKSVEMLHKKAKLYETTDEFGRTLRLKEKKRVKSEWETPVEQDKTLKEKKALKLQQLRNKKSVHEFFKQLS